LAAQAMAGCGDDSTWTSHSHSQLYSPRNKTRAPQRDLVRSATGHSIGGTVRPESAAAGIGSRLSEEDAAARVEGGVATGSWLQQVPASGLELLLCLAGWPGELSCSIGHLLVQ